MYGLVNENWVILCLDVQNLYFDWSELSCVHFSDGNIIVFTSRRKRCCSIIKKCLSTYLETQKSVLNALRTCAK